MGSIPIRCWQLFKENMSLKINHISASTKEGFIFLADNFEKLLKIIQTINNKEILVDVKASFLSIEIRPLFPIDGLRIMSRTENGKAIENAPEVLWTDFQDDCVWIKTNPDIYRIFLKPDIKGKL